MGRWIAVVAVLLLAGCASTRDYYYDDGYYGRDRYAYDRYGYDDRYAGGSYYHRGSPGHGDYWYAESYRYPGYFDTPYYYSLFWPINRWYHDPFWYPGYHYGVTWFPRNYLSFSVGWGHGWGHFNRFAYSPYRYGWSDWAYDWYPWYRAYPNYAGYYGRPRFGDARNEAERLARLSGAHRAYKQRSDVLAQTGRGLPVAGRAAGVRSADARSVSARGLPAATPRAPLPTRSRAGTARSEGYALPRSAPRASLRQERGLPERAPARGRAAYERSGYDRASAYEERNRGRALPQRVDAMPRYRTDPALQRGMASRGIERLPARGYEPALREYPAAPRGRAELRGGYDVGVGRAPVAAPSLPSRSVAAPAPRAQVERSAPPSRSSERSGRSSSRGRGSEDQR